MLQLCLKSCCRQCAWANATLGSQSRPSAVLNTEVTELGIRNISKSQTGVGWKGSNSSGTIKLSEAPSALLLLAAHKHCLLGCSMLPVGYVRNILGLAHRWSYVTCWHIQEVECYYMVVFWKTVGAWNAPKWKELQKVYMNVHWIDREKGLLCRAWLSPGPVIPYWLNRQSEVLKAWTNLTGDNQVIGRAVWFHVGTEQNETCSPVCSTKGASPQSHLFLSRKKDTAVWTLWPHKMYSVPRDGTWKKDDHPSAACE